jgi:hypothetical protein
MSDHVALLSRYFHQHRRGGFIDELVFAARSGLRSGEVAVDDTTADDRTAALRLVPEVRRDLDRAEVALIESLVDLGWTWEQLGAAYGGRSKQAMQQHYRRRGGHRTWPTGERHARTPLTAEQSPHRLVPAELDPADVEAACAAITHLMATAHDVVDQHSTDGAWALEPDDVAQERIAAIGLEVLPRLEMACRAAAKAITDMVVAGWERRDPGREARRRGSWTVRLDDSLKEMASWLDKLPDVPLPRFDRPLVLAEAYRVTDDHLEVDRADADVMRASIDQAIARLDRHRATIDQNIDELRRRRAEITPG